MRTAADQLKRHIEQGIKDALAQLEGEARQVRRIGARLKRSVGKVGDKALRAEIQRELEELALVLEGVFPLDRVQWM